MNKNKFTIFETFVGAGGSHIGFKKEGFLSVYVNDFNSDCIETLLYNNPEIKKSAFIDNSSILDINEKKLFEKLNYSRGDIDVFFGGIVCKGFSLAGERSPNDERNYFYNKQISLVKKIKPKISIIENVPGIKNAKILSSKAPLEVKKKVDSIWQSLEDYKGQKADLRKKNLINDSVEELGKNLRSKKEKINQDIIKNKYLISVLEDIENQYNEIGYNVKIKSLNAAWYGAATKRERVFIVATRKDLNGEFNFPNPIFHSNEVKTKYDFDIDKNKLKKPITINDILSKINYKNDKDIDNKPMNHADKTVERFRYIPEGGNIANVIDELPEYLKISKFYSRGNTMRLNGAGLSPTLVPGHSNFPVHPKEHRSITVREAAMISGFPIDYKFFGSHTKRCEHVGNAVPPPLAQAMAKQCVKFLEKCRKS